jgi:asparagine N-glycosylation enzyme membrane subunit Stt3
VDAGHVDSTIGFEVAAASLGAAALSGLAGVIAERKTLEIIGPFLVVGALIMFVLHELVVRRAENTQA